MKKVFLTGTKKGFRIGMKRGSRIDTKKGFQIDTKADLQQRDELPNNWVIALYILTLKILSPSNWTWNQPAPRTALASSSQISVRFPVICHRMILSIPVPDRYPYCSSYSLTIPNQPMVSRWARVFPNCTYKILYEIRWWSIFIRIQGRWSLILDKFFLIRVLSENN